MNNAEYAQGIIASRKDLAPEEGFVLPANEAAEGGCGVIGLSLIHISEPTRLC